MPDHITKYTYKIKAAIALAASLELLTAQEIGRQGINPDALYEKIHEQGYVWEQAKQKWSKRLYKNGKAVFPASERPVDNVRAAPDDHTVNVTFVASHELVLRTIADFRVFCDLLDIVIVEELSPHRVPHDPEELVWQLKLEYPKERKEKK